MKKAIIGGNHQITGVALNFEKRALEHATRESVENLADLILFFDQEPGLGTLSFVPNYKHLPIVEIKNFVRAGEIPSLPENTFLVFENSLRNYARGTFEKGRESALTKGMFHQNDDMIVCHCLALYIALIEILKNRGYEKITFIAELGSTRARQVDLLKVKVVFPEMELVWV